MNDATQINTAIPLVVKRENYADRLTRWMETEKWRTIITPKMQRALAENRHLSAEMDAVLKALGDKIARYPETTE